MLNFAIQTARDAGHLLAERLGRTSLRIENKSEIDLVTESDLASERLIIDRIKTYYPRHAILAEESGATAPTMERRITRTAILVFACPSRLSKKEKYSSVLFTIQCEMNCSRLSEAKAQRSMADAFMLRQRRTWDRRCYAPAFLTTSVSVESSRGTLRTSS